MSASPTNADLGLTEEATHLGTAPTVPAKSEPPASSTSHEALQALLAFSSFHEQIRQRRARELRNGGRVSPEGAWEVEQFVLDEVLHLVAERALVITGADGVAIALAEGNAIICRGSAGEIAPDPGMHLDPNSGFSGACFRTGRIIRCDDAENDPRVNVQAAHRLGARSMVAVPLAGQHSVIGLLEAFSYDAFGFNDSDVRSLNLLGELILSAMRPEEEDRMTAIAQSVATQAEAPLETAEPGIPNGQAEVFRQFSQEVREPEQPEHVPVPPPLSEHQQSESSRPGLLVVLVVLLVAIALGGGLWWKMRQKTGVVSVSPQLVALAPAPAPVPAPVLPTSSESRTAPAIQDKLALLPQVTGIRHWSSADSSTVVVDLQDQVQYEDHRLSDPERIYFDLHDTALAPGLFGKTIEVRDALLVRVRIAQPTPGVTRVVLETKSGADFSVSMEMNPYRLVVEVRAAGAAPGPRARVDLFAPMSPPPARRLTPSAKSADDTQVRAHVPKFRIVLDAGHGGWDLGTVGRRGLLEKDVVLDIVQRLGSLIESRSGAEVVYTRSDDSYVALEQRAEIANQAQSDFFVSIHANYSDDSSARGVETYYTNTFSSVNAHSHETDVTGKALQTVSFANVDIREKVRESRMFAASVQRALFATLAAKNPGIRNRGVKEASYVVLTGTSMPAILAEVSFVSSPTDETNLQNSKYRQQIAEALYKGIVRFATDSHKVKPASASAKPSGQ
jgi:N-acetylmuramoyl-L-alanine amidase